VNRKLLCIRASQAIASSDLAELFGDDLYESASVSEQNEMDSLQKEIAQTVIQLGSSVTHRPKRRNRRNR
jgi:hypothetical protein